MEKGYKVFNSDWTCRDFQYEVGKTYEIKSKPILCENGFHYCLKLIDCFRYYDFNPQNKVAKIIAHGIIDGDNNDNKHCTNKIEIVEEITWYEVLDMVNSGSGNSGYLNSGDYNSGNYNSGDYNIGDYNSGNCNSGDYNIGDYNSGNYNIGDYNSGYYNSGCFNTDEPTLRMFNKSTTWKYRDWLNSEARYILSYMPYEYSNFISESEMTEEEKEQHPEYKTTGGFVKVFTCTTEYRQKWWDELSENKKEAVKSLPNFDSEKFCKCVGIYHI